MLDLKEGQLLDVDSLPSVVYLLPVQTQPQCYYGYFMFVGIGVRLANHFGCACPKHK